MRETVSMAYLLAFLIGVVAGLRTMTAPAAVSWASYLGRLHLDGTWLALVASTIRIDGSASEDQLSVAEVDATDGVVTACATAVAETGTLILDGSAGMGRRMITLIPDYHLCVVLPGHICADVPQALARLDGTRPVTMISGPSATSDIELNRVEGVHGPRTLEVIIVGDAAEAGAD